MNHQLKIARFVACTLMLTTLFAALPFCTTNAQRRIGERRNTPDARSRVAPAHLQVVRNRAPLPALPLYPLPLTSVKPRGWLRRQLQIQAEGVTGKIDEFWKDLNSNSAWLGGTGEDWERGPYYMDGLVPLAYLLDDPKLIAKANKWVGSTLANGQADGYLGPAKNDAWWSRMIMLKVLATPWNYGLMLPTGDIEGAVEVVIKPIGNYPFTAAGTPVELRVKARRVPGWKVEMNSAGAPPQSPVESREPVEIVTLIPYGAAKLRITAFPRIK